MMIVFKVLKMPETGGWGSGSGGGRTKSAGSANAVMIQCALFPDRYLSHQYANVLCMN